MQLKVVAGLPARRADLGRRVRPRARREAPADAAAAGSGAAEPQLASTFAVGEESAAFGAGGGVSSTPAAEVLAPLDKIAAAVRRGESVRVEVVVRTRKVGHFFPGGTVDAFDVWVELEAVDDKGRVLLHSGAVADGGKGPVDPGAHFYRSLQLDEHGNPINKRNAWVDALGRLRAADPAGRRRHRALPAATSPRTPAIDDHPAGEGELPQVRLVEHAVGVRRRARSGGREPAGQPSRTTMAAGCSPATRRRSRGRSRRSPTSRSP